MKKLHFILTLSAFVIAGLGVFATNAKNSDASMFPVIDEWNGTVCSLPVDVDCTPIGNVNCTFSGTIGSHTYTSVDVKDATASCNVLRRTNP